MTVKSFIWCQLIQLRKNSLEVIFLVGVEGTSGVIPMALMEGRVTEQWGGSCMVPCVLGSVSVIEVNNGICGEGGGLGGQLVIILETIHA